MHFQIPKNVVGEIEKKVEVILLLAKTEWTLLFFKL